MLRHADYGEADRLLTLYTRQLGKTRALAKGARKIASRKAGHIEPFTHVKLQLAKGRDMPLVTQADTVDAYQALREDLILTSQAAYVLELLDRFTYEDEMENTRHLSPAHRYPLPAGLRSGSVACHPLL